MRASQFFTAALGATLFGAAQAADKPLLMSGRLSAATLKSGETEDTWATGGTLTVNGITITVPKYLQVAFPATFISWPDFIEEAGSYIGYEIEVVGNYVEDRDFEPIAGQISISQTFLQGGSGIIASIDASSGEITMVEGNKIRINDPTGAYGPASTAHKFFTSDPENPSISSFSGYPMCVQTPDNHDICDSANRPTGQGTHTVQNPVAAAPLAPGDQIDYSGIEEDGIIYAYNLVCNNLNLLTRNTDPVYLRIEDALIGVFSPLDDLEVAGHRFVGFLSNANPAHLPIQIKGIKPDFCTGEVTYTDVGFVTEIGDDNRIKFDWRNRPRVAETYYREYYLRASSNLGPWRDTEDSTKPNIVGGQYIMPVSEWIQPELTTPGLLPPPHEFKGMYHLATGLGWDGEHLWRPLTPFPQSGFTDESPSAETCEEQRAAAAGGGGDGGAGGDTGGDTTPPPEDNTCPTSPDTVTIVQGAPDTQWVSSGRGTLTVTCRSSVTSDAQKDCVGMVLNVVNRDTNNQGDNFQMNYVGNGEWTFGQRRIREPTRIRCTSLLNGVATQNNPF